jgi:biopolymer transport protein ExbD
MRLHTREEGGSAAINLTPLIDMVFILLIFFAVNSTFVRFPGVDVDQPSAQTSVVQKNQTILVAVTAADEVWIDKQRIDVRRLRSAIERLYVETPDAPVVVLADQEADAGTVVQVIDQARLAGASRVAIAATTEEPR